MDKAIKEYLDREKKRQKVVINLIASENYVSKDILELQGSILTNKYAEGYPGKRYYGGCKNIDMIENLAIEYGKKLFNCKHINVQPHSGSNANIAVYNALLTPGDTILSMSLKDGGHLSHGHSVNISGKLYKIYNYCVDKETELLDYEEIKKLAISIKPKLIIAGASAYSRNIDFKKFREIANMTNSYLLADISHIAGLVVANLHQSPVEYADIVTSTTHKTLRGPRGGIILTNDEKLASLINKSVFPGLQGGPLEHVIAAKAQCFYEAMSEEFINYQRQILKNIKVMEKVFNNNNIKLISGGSDNHLLLINTVDSFNITGLEAEKLLEDHNIIVNKNTIPFDELSPNVTSGIRIGSPYMTTMGYKEKEFEDIAIKIMNILSKTI